jgi:hypothetical protein
MSHITVLQKYVREKKMEGEKKEKKAADLHFSGAVHSNLLVKPAG